MQRCFAPFFFVALINIFVSGIFADYDYFRNSQYPGERRKDVSLDKVIQAPGEGYQKRIVHWWPRQGVDYVKAPSGAVYRTWTIRENTARLTDENVDYVKWWPVALRGKKQFQAHLLGFRGIGNKTNKYFWEDNIDNIDEYVGKGLCPAVVLRLEDGRKRCFTRGSFSDADQAFIIDLYEKEMARIRETLEAPPTKTLPRIAAEWPKGEYYKPGTHRLESDRFAAVSGSEPPRDGIGSPWLDDDEKEKCTQYRAATMRVYEDYWAYNEYAGHLMPYWERDERYKYVVRIGGTRINGTKVSGRGNGGGYGGCNTGGGNWLGLYHEWGHGSNCGGMISIGGGETQCDAHQTMADPAILEKVMFQNEKPWKNLFWGQYPGGLVWAMMGDSPNWGYAAVSVIPPLMADNEHTPMHAIARLGEERGIFENGVRGMGDFLGQIGARMAEYDTELETGLRGYFVNPNRSHLMAVDREQGHYRSLITESPEPFGVNLVRLIPEEGAKEITVDFQGQYDPDTYSDWRACIVAVEADSTCRYSPLWNKGKMSLPIKRGDKRFWLTVTATPKALISGHATGKFTAVWVYQGAFSYRYPYDVTLSGCLPGSPHVPVGDNDNLTLAGTHHPRVSYGPWPHPADTQGYRAMLNSLSSLKERLSKDHPRMATIDYLLENGRGARHPNGGGWVAASAYVAPTAFVGTEAMVLDGARVYDRAVIEDYAIVSGPDVLIKDNAKVYRKAVVKGKVTLSDYARVCRNIIVDKNEVERTGPEKRQEVFADWDIRLQANYACDRPETVLLEDCFQEHSHSSFYFGAHTSDLIFYDGMMHGNPGFVTDGLRRAFTFNGLDQYAELPGEAADTGKATLEIAFRWDGGPGRQSLFDFGSSENDCFVLSISESGKPELAIVTAGQLQTLTAPDTIPRDKWIQCRVEMDGRQVSLWVNDKLAAAADSDYRAADAFVPGEERISYLAASRGGANLFRGAIDYLHVYSTVYPDFTEAPDVPLVSSRRIDPGFLERLEQAYPGYEEKEIEFDITIKQHEIVRFYEDWVQRTNARIDELESCPEAAEMTVRLAELQSRYEIKKAEALAELDRDPEIIEKRRKLNETNKQFNNLLLEMAANHDDYIAAEKAQKEAMATTRKIEKQIREQAKASDDAEYAGFERRRRELDEKQKRIIETFTPAIENRVQYAHLMERKKNFKPDDEEFEKIVQQERILSQVYNGIKRAAPGYLEIENQLKRWREDEQNWIISKAGNNPEYMVALVADTKARQIKHDLNRQFRNHPEIVKLEKIREPYLTRGEEISAVTKHTEDISKRITKLESAIETKRMETAMERNADEYIALKELQWGKRGYAKITPQQLKKRLLEPFPEDKEQLSQALPFQQQKWHTVVDWNGKAFYELTDAKDKPIMQRWLKRVKPYMYDTK